MPSSPTPRASFGRVDSEAEVLSLFAPFDVYRQGRLHVREVVQLLTGYGEAMSEEDIAALVLEMDVDGDGCVDLARFVQHMNRTSAMD